MKKDYLNPTVFDHIEAARRINKLIVTTCKSGSIDHDHLMLLIKGQARNLEAIEDMITTTVSEFHDLPEAAMHGLNQMIRDNEDSAEIALPSPAEEADGKVVHVTFGKPLNPLAR